MIIFKSLKESIAKCIDICYACQGVCLKTADEIKNIPDFIQGYKAAMRCEEKAEQCALACENSSDNLLIALQECIDACNECAIICYDYENDSFKHCAEMCATCSMVCKQVLSDES